jgi:glycosyltransferase involved in cell wall biosynthesis
MNETTRGMSVLHVSSNRGWGGGENQVRLLMRELEKAGIDQLCIAPADSPLAQCLSYLKLPVKRVKWSTGSDPRALVALARTIRHFDVVHCHDAAALQLAIIPARLFGVPIIGARRVRFKTNAFKWNRADRVIAVSETVRAELIKAGVHDDRIRVIHSGTDLNETRSVRPLQPSLRSRFGLAANTFVAGNAAVFIPAKGQTLIPEAAALLPDVHWFIAGEGSERGAIEAAIRKYNVGDRVHLLGWLDDARPMLKELDAYVSASTDDGLGNSITESLALQLPVIVADAGGPGEIMKPIHDRTGAVLFEPRNARALADAITKLRAPGMRERVVAAQDERFADFAIERTGTATLAVYRELVKP